MPSPANHDAAIMPLSFSETTRSERNSDTANSLAGFIPKIVKHWPRAGNRQADRGYAWWPDLGGLDAGQRFDVSDEAPDARRVPQARRRGVVSPTSCIASSHHRIFDRERSMFILARVVASRSETGAGDQIHGLASKSPLHSSFAR